MLRIAMKSITIPISHRSEENISPRRRFLASFLVFARLRQLAARQLGRSLDY
jgi:hypothetical protein